VNELLRYSDVAVDVGPGMICRMELRLELVTVPVADVDRAKTFYADQVGFSVEQDVQVDEAL
jgi:predicted enzyme related to lactoylglutathione lyase